MRNRAALERIQVLRRELYLAEGKTPPPDDEQLDDPLLHVLAAERQGELAGAVCVRAPASSEVRYAWLPPEAQPGSAFNGGILPPPSRAVEIGRLFALPAHRGKHLSVALFQGVHQVLRSNARESLVIASTDVLRPSYEAIGFHRTGLRFTKAQRSGPQMLEVLVATHRHFGVYGLDAGPIQWCLYMQPVIDRLSPEVRAAMPLRERLLYRAYSPFKRVAWSLFERR